MIRFGETTVTFRSPEVDDSRGTAVAIAGPDGRRPVEHSAPGPSRPVPPLPAGTAFASPATNQQIADELFLSVDAVKTHLRVLFAKFGVEQLPQNQKRIRLVERAFYSGVISERDL